MKSIDLSDSIDKSFGYAFLRNPDIKSVRGSPLGEVQNEHVEIDLHLFSSIRDVVERFGHTDGTLLE